ncbi:Holliday junction branch migration protein RuvA [Corynebacterium macginleyi]|uniref:Holliday junction branch migration complex subunit RuvA n=1 Tax=Corynebacterium macginleyi TaxID=38290 RepID=A0A3M0GYY1_9CORY|nr:Holliday junction branch migration protein RuvA [Corynebacterium macginleyi]MBK4136943.1 Holliday junction branch migration protein RuvA [Corynebacterium macginleyi]MBK4140167.1 Holliday junction branch migration protein RuvA [Corynebacterium macginleyi]MBK4141502.1 Holliday junction branch migration protein RuvA [Corynebacterium macginleyi]MBK4143364.1 Holliday junction branch migration protein RuvA [Corynebacterium macginleyi]MBK4148494.1 Holliday junction branch migration protein RuvA [C
MIAALRGEVLHVGLNYGVIECGGVGYKFLATAKTLATLRCGETACVLTTLVVKEDALTLYGFTRDDDREMFQVLQSVSGLGPKLALAALSVMGAEDLAAAIGGEDVKALQTIPGVGKRMAQRLTLELKDKVARFAGTPTADTAAAAPSGGGPVVNSVTEALVGLGFTEKAALPVVEAVYAELPTADTSTLLRAALAQLGKQV